MTTAKAVESTTTNTTATTSSNTEAPGRACSRVVDFAAAETDWFIVNDGVMGGLSLGTGEVVDGKLVFQGTINTNGGGFSSVRSFASPGEYATADSLQIRLATKFARTYEFIIDIDNDELQRRVSYFGTIQTNDTSGIQEAEVHFGDFEPRIFGTPVPAPPIDPDQIEAIGIILADGLDGEFSLEVEWIDACS